MKRSWFPPIEVVVKQTSSKNLHLGSNHKNNGCSSSLLEN